MGDVTISCGVGVAGGAGQGLGGEAPRRGTVICPKCGHNAMVRMVAPSGEPSTTGSLARERVYQCTTPDCDTLVQRAGGS